LVSHAHAMGCLNTVESVILHNFARKFVQELPLKEQRQMW